MTRGSERHRATSSKSCGNGYSNNGMFWQRSSSWRTLLKNEFNSVCVSTVSFGHADRDQNRPATTARQLARNSGGLTENSLFSPVYEDDFNSQEAEFACYLDELKALRWW